MKRAEHVIVEQRESARDEVEQRALLINEWNMNEYWRNRCHSEGDRHSREWRDRVVPRKASQLKAAITSIWRPNRSARVTAKTHTLEVYFKIDDLPSAPSAVMNWVPLIIASPYTNRSNTDIQMSSREMHLLLSVYIQSLVSRSVPTHPLQDPSPSLATTYVRYPSNLIIADIVRTDHPTVSDSPAARWANGARSPEAPTVPCDGISGIHDPRGKIQLNEPMGKLGLLLLNANRSSLRVSSEIPEKPLARILIRNANIIRACSIGNGRPTPAQWETIRRDCKSLSKEFNDHKATGCIELP